MTYTADVCPYCHRDGGYLLADGRFLCRECRRKSSPTTRRSRLTDDTMAQLIDCFWKMVPASRAAEAAGVNKKTVQRYYNLLRSALWAAGEAAALVRHGVEWVPYDAFRGGGVEFRFSA